MEKNTKLQIVKEAVRTYPNFPKEGILFRTDVPSSFPSLSASVPVLLYLSVVGAYALRDIFSVFQNVTAMRALRDLLVEHALFLHVDVIVGLDSRGFLIGPLIAVELGKPFLPIRKSGKLPGHVARESYTLEYGEATFEIQDENISEGTRVLIVDDLLATGGSMGAAIRLLEKNGAVIVECLVVIELSSLKGRNKVGAPVHSLIKYD